MDTDLISIQEARDLVERAYEASRKLLAFSQEQVDAVVDAMAEAARNAADELARDAVEETGYGVVADKVQKNLLAARDVHAAIRPMKTVGVLREDRDARVLEIAVPMGVVAAVLPTTNPTSTAIYKILISLKSRNSVVLSPHPNAIRCTCKTAAILYEAARKAGGPEHVIGCFQHPTAAGTQEMMKHRRTGVILSTGGVGIVRAAYSSGKPAYGVGPGNVPAFVERSADVPKAVADVVRGKTFDNGTLCSSEQAIVAEEAVQESVVAELRRNGAYFLSDNEAQALARLLITPNWTVNPKCVGKPATTVAQLAGLQVPAETRLLVARLTGVGRDHPLSAEKLSPVLSLYVVKDFEEGCRTCESILRFGGLGHTCVIHSRDDQRIREFGLRMPAFRVVVNSPAAHGSVGYSTSLFPAMTLGCGALGGNITGDNISPLHLINVKRVAYEVRPVAETQPAARSRAAASRQPPAPPPAPPPLRGVATAEGRTASCAPGPVVVNRETVARVVERFLAAKAASASASPGPPATPPAPARATVGSASAPAAASPPTPSPAAVPASPSPEKPPSSPPPVKVVDFVCESDVRVAVTRSEKIFIGPRTIVTPSARELADGKDVLVLVHDAQPRRGK